MLDGLDGAVAARRGTASATGTRVDHGCDRVTDVLFAAALHRHGARRPSALAAAVAPLVLELYRESMRAGVAGAPGIATVGERPVRVVLVIAGLAAAPTAAATAIAGLAAAGCLQLRAARRRAQ
jgi:CDP-diacylglycerol--glycerol-3-phosphate 3-phosphatidyltransferase